MSRDAWEAVLRSAGAGRVSIGFGGVHIHPAAGLDEAQVGYAVDPGGEPLTGTGEDDWHPSWLVIGHDTRGHDPIFVDLARPGLPVFTAMHGMGYWEADPVADSAEAFFRSLDLMRAAAAGREHPVAYAANPLPDAERRALLGRIAALNPRSGAGFWESLLGQGS